MDSKVGIKGVYEVAVKVRNLEAADAFYREVLGLETGLIDEPRRWIFLRAGKDGVVLLQEVHDAFPQQHFAFAVDDADLDRAIEKLKEKEIRVIGPIFHEWMKGRSVYFADPDNHELELFAIGEQRPTDRTLAANPRAA